MFVHIFIMYESIKYRVPALDCIASAFFLSGQLPPSREPRQNAATRGKVLPFSEYYYMAVVYSIL